MNHFLTSVDWSRTCPLQQAATSAVPLSFAVVYLVSLLFSTLRDHEQSSRDETLSSLRSSFSSPCIEKVGRFDVRYISNDCTFLWSKGRHTQ